MPHLFRPLQLRGLTLPNRIAVSPMCQYSCQDGLPNDWHLVHLGGLAQGGAGLVFTEAAAVLPEGRISPEDLGLWNMAQAEGLARSVHFIKTQGAVPGIQLAHAGRKASAFAPWKGSGSVPPASGGWTPVAPSALPFDSGWTVPTALDEAGILAVIEAFMDAARRAVAAASDDVEARAAVAALLDDLGFDPVELPFAAARQLEGGGPVFGRWVDASGLRSALSRSGVRAT